jgi:hypothetical protein
MNLPGGLAATLALVLLINPAGRAEGGDSLRPTARNLEKLQRLLDGAATEIASRSHSMAGDTVELRVSAGADSWVVENALLRALKALGCTAFVTRATASPGSGLRWEIGPATMDVRYDKMFRDGLFGAKKVRRTVSVSMSYQTLKSRGGEISSADVIERAAVDTVAVDEVPDLEHADLKSTRGELPSDQFLDKVIEPFIIIGATGVAVYLLFHVRS